MGLDYDVEAAGAYETTTDKDVSWKWGEAREDLGCCGGGAIWTREDYLGKGGRNGEDAKRVGYSTY